MPTPSVDGPLGEVIAALMVKEPTERITLREVRNRLHPLLPPPSTPLLSEDDLTRLNEATTSAPVEEPEEDGDEGDGSDPDDIDVESPEDAAAEPAPLAAAPGAVPTPESPAAAPGSLAPAPGPLPFDAAYRAKVRRGRGGLATTVIVVVSVLLFCMAAAGGFALSRRIGGEPLLPPTRSTAPPTTQVAEPPGTLRTVQGNAATLTGAQGGGFTVPVPGNWVKFVEEIGDKELANNTRVYYVSPDGTQVLTVVRFASFYPDHSIEDYLDRLREEQPEVTSEEPNEIPGGAGREPARELSYRTTADAKALVPNDRAALNQYRVKFAHLLPVAADLWVVSMTVPIDQEDAGSTLFDKIAPEFEVTG